MMSHRDIVELWPTAAAMAADLNVTTGRVHKWRQRNRIPSDYWPAIVRASNRRRLAVSYETLATANGKAA